MNILLLLGVAVGLAMDAAAVAIATSVRLCGVTRTQTWRMSLAFGFFQFGMPILGWWAGQSVAGYVLAYDHWVAFGLLLAVGGHMLVEALANDGEQRTDRDPTRGLTLLLLSIATSIDALAIGISFALLQVSIWFPALVIGLVTGLLTAVSMQVGCKLGRAYGKRMDVVGGLVLIAIGVKILLEHLR
jgi:putative Mn2+ efflux pump MntP